MRDYTPYTDEELLDMLEKGEEDVTEFLIEKYKPMVRQRVRVMYLMGGDQDDLIQEGMIGLFKAVRDYRKDREASFHTFAHLCVDRQIYRAIQSYSRQKHQPLNSYVSLSADTWETEPYQEAGQNPESIIIDQENTVHMEKNIRQQLSKFENQVLEMYLDGDNYLEIAEQLGKSPKSIDNALQRIRNKVREYLESK